jgi:hypothetical protein
MANGYSIARLCSSVWALKLADQLRAIDGGIQVTITRDREQTRRSLRFSAEVSPADRTRAYEVIDGCAEFD